MASYSEDEVADFYGSLVTLPSAGLRQTVYMAWYARERMREFVREFYLFHLPEVKDAPETVPGPDRTPTGG